MTTGEIWRGIALGAFCGLVVGSEKPLVGVALVGGLRLPSDPPHPLERLHVFQRCFQRLGGRLHRLHQRLTSGLSDHPRLFAIGSCCLANFPQVFLLLTRRLERLAFAVTTFTRLLCQLPEAFGFVVAHTGP